MIKNIKKLAEYGEIALRNKVGKDLSENLALIEKRLDIIPRMGSEVKPEEIKRLFDDCQVYKKLKDNTLASYGIEFPDLEKKYNLLLPKINEYI